MSRPQQGPRPASPSAMRPGTTMARRWRTARFQKSSSTPRPLAWRPPAQAGHLAPLLCLPPTPLPPTGPGGLLSACGELAAYSKVMEGWAGRQRQSPSGLGRQGQPNPALSRGSARPPPLQPHSGLVQGVGSCLFQLHMAMHPEFPVSLVGEHVWGPSWDAGLVCLCSVQWGGSGPPACLRMRAQALPRSCRPASCQAQALPLGPVKDHLCPASLDAPPRPCSCGRRRQTGSAWEG